MDRYEMRMFVDRIKGGFSRSCGFESYKKITFRGDFIKFFFFIIDYLIVSNLI
jgi:hypothetical protein